MQIRTTSDKSAMPGNEATMHLHMKMLGIGTYPWKWQVLWIAGIHGNIRYWNFVYHNVHPISCMHRVNVIKGSLYSRVYGIHGNIRYQNVGYVTIVERYCPWECKQVLTIFWRWFVHILTGVCVHGNISYPDSVSYLECNQYSVRSHSVYTTRTSPSELLRIF